MNKKMKTGACLVAAAAVAAGAAWFGMHKDPVTKIYGSVDTRVVRLAFEESGRLSKLLFEEGALVRAGETVAELDAERYEIAVRNAAASQDVAKKNLDLALAGTRSEDLAAARARLQAQKATVKWTDRVCARERKLGSATSPLRVDQACTEASVARAQEQALARELSRMLAGTRAEEIAVYRAQLELAQTQLEQARRALKNCRLVAPSDMVVRVRLKEPGDMVSSSAPVLEAALMKPLWVRAWIDEVNLDKVSPGQKVTVTSDSYPDRRFTGTVGFVSSVAEFTPKTVQTESVRTSLVYEVRITVTEHADFLRQGMPVTVDLTGY